MKIYLELLKLVNSRSVKIMLLILIFNTGTTLFANEKVVSFPEIVSSPVNNLDFLNNKSETDLNNYESTEIEVKDSKNLLNNRNIGVKKFSGLLDKNTNLFFFTIKSPTKWGSEPFLYVYSLKDQDIVKRISFDSSGNYKYPISISPDSKILVLAETGQSIGNTGLIVINLEKDDFVETINNVYAPETLWSDDNSLIYLRTQTQCTNEGCQENGLNVNKRDLDTKINRVKNISKISKAEKLPVLDDMKLEDGRIKFESKDEFLNKTHKEIGINLNF